MNFWVALIAYEVVWFVAVIGAGHGLGWPGVLAAALFVGWRLAVSRQRAVELRLGIVGLIVGLLLEAAWTAAGLVHYAAAWPAQAAPAWLIALWVTFAFTIVPLFGYLHDRPWLAALFGGIGGPLAYLGAARGWHAVTMAVPAWHTLAALAAGWAIALPLLTSLAHHWLQPTATERAA
ncbi:DUF2878 domain-containing protein [Dyella sp. A6]|uniref:DUF2878 domain-containing protein n=1 Tax=Dyella aluminiiresistens TaxID=3069105 RepID=UPI002E7A0172|nr:DUF2878 domain-containing protein [Dyella sp. A6]